jgi:hypothetical protein
MAAIAQMEDEIKRERATDSINKRSLGQACQTVTCLN